jgi:tartrate dehydratase beta subunit/fumarate hydratase class I family protein
MVISISSPLSSGVVSRLCAGDEVALTGRVLLLRGGEEPNGEWPAEVVEGSVCCFVADAGDWVVARIDEVTADRAVRSLLATGARGFIAAGQCLATASYALRKYGGVFFAVDPDWLTTTGAALPKSERPLPLVTFLEVDQAPLRVAHDTHGRSAEC